VAIDDQVDIALAEAELRISEAVKGLTIFLLDNGRSAFERKVSEEACTEISPICVRKTSPSTPMKSPISMSFFTTLLYRVLSSPGQISSRVM